MIEHVWSVLCTKSIIDRDSNNLSLIDTLEQLNLSPDVEFPAVIGNAFELVSMWSRSNYDELVRGRARVIVENPSSQTRELPEYEIDLWNSRRFRYRINIQGFSLNEPGKFIFHVELLEDGGEGEPVNVANIPLDVRITDPQNPD